MQPSLGILECLVPFSRLPAFIEDTCVCKKNKLTSNLNRCYIDNAQCFFFLDGKPQNISAASGFPGLEVCNSRVVPIPVDVFVTSGFCESRGLAYCSPPIWNAKGFVCKSCPFPSYCIGVIKRRRMLSFCHCFSGVKCVTKVTKRICKGRYAGRSCLKWRAFVGILGVYLLAPWHPTETQFQS